MKTLPGPLCGCNPLEAVLMPLRRGGLPCIMASSFCCSLAVSQKRPFFALRYLTTTGRKFAGLSLVLCLLDTLESSAQLVNDRCDGAIPIVLDTLYQMNTATATSTEDPTEICSGPFGHSVWFSLTPPRSGLVTLSTCGSDFDTAFQLYTGSCSNLTIVLCSDDGGPACPNQQASASFLGYAGVTYTIVVGGYGGASGHLELMATMPRPPNDQCSGALPLAPDVPVTVN